MKSAAQVGVLLVVFAALLLGSYSLLGHSLFAPKSEQFFSNIDDAGGITEGTPVLMAGVNVGTVSRVALLSPRMARMTLNINHGTRIPVGSEVLISQSLIGLGQTPVSIQPPPSADALSTSAVAATGPGWAPPGSTLPGRRLGPLDSLLPNSKQTVAELTNTLAAFRKLLEDEKLRGHLDALLVSTQHSMEKFGQLAGNVSSTLGAHRLEIDRAIVAASNAVQNVQRMTLQLAQYAKSGDFQRRAGGILTEVDTIERHTDNLVSNLNRLINDPSLRRPASDIAQNVDQITQTGKSIAAYADDAAKNAAAITQNGIEISKNFATVSQKAITLTDQANQIATNALDIENRFKGALDKVGGFFDHAPSTKGFKLESEVDLLRQTDPGTWRTDITFDTPIPDGTLYAGVYDAFETNKFTIEVGHPFLQRGQYRYGIYASKPAVGVDFPLAKRLYLRGDLWDINNPQLTIRARYDFGGGLSGWLGVDHVFHENSPTIGVGIVR